MLTVTSLKGPNGLVVDILYSVWCVIEKQKTGLLVKSYMEHMPSAVIGLSCQNTS